MNRAEVVVHGHRGCRGLMPENTIPAFIRALELGANAIELDVVCTSDRHLLVSHEPWMDHEKCDYPDGTSSPQMEEKTNIYRMDLATAQSFVCGSRRHTNFPDQKLVKSYKPSLEEAVNSIIHFAKQFNCPIPLFNIEIKSNEYWQIKGREVKGDEFFHPAPAEYAGLVAGEIERLELKEHCIIQSFDPRILREISHIDSAIRCVLLTESKEISIEEQIQSPGVDLFGFSVRFDLIDQELIRYCETHHIELLAWTVNEEPALKSLRQMGVKHIITDFPDRVRNWLSL